MSNPSQLKAMLKKDIIEANAKLQDEINRMNNYHSIFKESVNLCLSTKASEVKIELEKVAAENQKLHSENNKIRFDIALKNCAINAMENPLKALKMTGNELASIISNQMPGSLRDSLFSEISDKELGLVGVCSGLTPAQTLKLENKSGIPVVHFKRTITENSDLETIQNEVKNMKRKQARKTAKIPMRKAVKSTHATGKIIKTTRAKRMVGRNEQAIIDLITE